MTLCLTAVSAGAGWRNEGWSGANWDQKACNSQTTVYSSDYKWAEATAKMGPDRTQAKKDYPVANEYAYALQNGYYSETCETWGNVESK